MFAATGETGNCAAQRGEPAKLLTTIRTAIDKPRDVSSRRKRQIVTALLVGDSQVATGLPPLVAVRQNPPTTGAKLGENMRQLMAQRAIDFGRMLEQPRI